MPDPNEAETSSSEVERVEREELEECGSERTACQYSLQGERPARDHRAGHEAPLALISGQEAPKDENVKVSFGARLDQEVGGRGAGLRRSAECSERAHPTPPAPAPP
eukprot:8218371-Pyramimonas_sp.AAC.1